MPINYGMTGVESFILQLATAQKRAGLAPGITMEIAGREELAASAASIGVPMLDFPPALNPPAALLRRPVRIVNSLRRILALRRVLREYDAVHMHSSGFVGLEALLAAALAGTRSVVVTHHMTVTIYRKYWSRLGTLTLWLQKRLASSSVMPYREAADELVEVGLPAQRVRVVPYCIDEQRFSGENVPPAADEPLQLIMVARLHEGKGHDVLLDALAELRRRNRAVRLVMVGRGDTRAAIARQIEALDLQDMAELREHVDHSEIPAMLRAAHVIVLPSFMEGETFPLSLLEGQLIGLPAIGSRWFGIPSIIEDGETGFVVTPRHAGELADAIERLVVDRALYLRMSANARARARAHFTGTAVAATYDGLYRKLAPQG
jgi:glycosyltransferase involved in cell wall biosynthesis